MEFCPFIGFKILSFLKNFKTDFSGTIKARKLKFPINMNNDWMYHVYRNRDQGFITLGVMSLDRFSNFAILENFRNRFLRNYELGL